MTLRKPLLALFFASASTAALGNYVGTLKPAPFEPVAGAPLLLVRLARGCWACRPASTPMPATASSWATSRRATSRSKASTSTTAQPAPTRSRAPPEPGARAFAAPASGSTPSPPCRCGSKLSLYGRFGAYRGDVRPPFAPYSTALLADATRGTRMRYGLGMALRLQQGLRHPCRDWSATRRWATSLPDRGRIGSVSRVGARQWRF